MAGYLSINTQLIHISFAIHFLRLSDNTVCKYCYFPNTFIDLFKQLYRPSLHFISCPC